MSTIAECIYDLLSRDSAVAGDVDTRIYPKRTKTDVKHPNIDYSKTSKIKQHDHEEGSTGLFEARWTVRCFARTYREAARLAAKVEAALDGFKGTVLGRQLQHIEQDNSIDLPFDDSARSFGVALDFIIWHTR